MHFCVSYWFRTERKISCTDITLIMIKQTEISIFQMTSQLSWEKPAMQITCTVICWWPPATGFIVQLSIMHKILSHHQSLLQFFSYTNCMNRVKVAEGILLAVTFYSVHSLCTLFFSWTSSCSWISCGCSQPRSARPTQADTILGNSTGLCVHFHRAMVLRIFFKCLEIVNSVLYQPELSVSLQWHRLWYQIAVSGSCPCSNYLFPYVI